MARRLPASFLGHLPGLAADFLNADLPLKDRKEGRGGKQTAQGGTIGRSMS